MNQKVKRTIKPGRILATVAIAGGLLAGATGVANADDWGWDHGHGGPGWHDRGWNGGWNGGYNGGWGDPAPGGWNGGWEPWGGVCLFGACV